jgi:hypothetical protein
MNAALENGDAAPLGQGTWWAARHQGGWWVEYENGWLRIIDEQTERDLDHVAARLAEVNADVHGSGTIDGRSEPGADDDGEAGTR